MREIWVSRRGFMQGAGAVALAAVCSGMLTGCSGSGSNSFTPSEEVTLGDYKVKITGTTISDNQTFGENGTEYVFIPKVKITFIGSGFAGKYYKDVFSAKIAGEEMTLTNGKEMLFTTETPVVDIPKNYYPQFSTDNMAAYQAFASGSAAIELTVTQNQQTAVFAITADGHNYSAELKSSNG